MRWVDFNNDQKGMTFDHDFGYSFPPFSSLLTKKREEEKENEDAKIVIKAHTFLLDRFYYIRYDHKKKKIYLKLNKL